MRREAQIGLKTLTVVALACVAFSTSCILPRFEPDCPGTANCEDCIDTAGCGFCERTSSCMAGTAMGPDARDDCSPANWRFNSCEDPPGRIDCPHTDCGVCLVGGDDECGWCFATGECWPTANPPSSCTLVTDYDACY